MKTWKDVPHLFANGKFKAMLFGNEEYVITGITRGNLILSKYVGTHNQPVEDCTLIARKIDSLTDEELNEIAPSWDGAWDLFRSKMIFQSKTNGMSGHLERCLSKRGVYFFSQSHFENGTVIDINTL